MVAKQVLSQLSYTPTVGVTSILKHFRRFQNPFLRFSILWSEPRFETVLVCSSRVSVRSENLISARDYFAQKLNFNPNWTLRGLLALPKLPKVLGPTVKVALPRLPKE